MINSNTSLSLTISSIQSSTYTSTKEKIKFTTTSHGLLVFMSHNTAAAINTLLNNNIIVSYVLSTLQYFTYTKENKIHLQHAISTQ